ncbi:transposase [Formosa sp. 4Alg 33]|uniref:transposase n=1 Tax=Formosa sp. 4Alg 33 TaxID=3382189 RepID=UPI003D9C3923
MEYLPKQCISLLTKQMNGRSSRELQKEFPKLRKQYWGKYFGQQVIVFGLLKLSQMKW